LGDRLLFSLYAGSRLLFRKETLVVKGNDAEASDARARTHHPVIHDHCLHSLVLTECLLSTSQFAFVVVSRWLSRGPSSLCSRLPHSRMLLLLFLVLMSTEGHPWAIGCIILFGV